MKKLILFGTGDLAQIACEYFSNDSSYEVAGFTVDRSHLHTDTLMGLPVVAFEEVESFFPPEEHDIHVCLIYNDMNRLRAKKCAEAKIKRYDLTSYISPRAFVSPSAKIGEHVFIFEGNVIQPFVEIGDRVILWSGNHIGHHSVIENDVFISSHVVISGHCNIGGNTFIGVNSTLANSIKIGKRTWISFAAKVSGNIPDGSMIRSLHKDEITQLDETGLARALQRAR